MAQRPCLDAFDVLLMCCQCVANVPGLDAFVTSVMLL